MPTARYFRMSSLYVPGAYLEVSEIGLWDGSGRVDTSGTLSASTAPASGSVSSLQDSGTSTRASWTQATVNTPAFYLQWDLGSALSVLGVKVAGFDTTDGHPQAFTMQYSSDGIAWTTWGSVVGLAYPGSYTYTPLVVPTPHGAVFELDVSDYTSGQVLANKLVSPADGLTQTAYDFHLGSGSGSEGSDPAYVDAEDLDYFSFSGSQYMSFVGSAGTQFLKDLHKGGAKYTLLMVVSLPASYTGGISPMFDSGTSDQGGSDMSRGVMFMDWGTSYGQQGYMNFRVKADSGATSLVLKKADTALPAESVQLIAVSYDGSGGPSFFYRNGAYDKVSGADTWTAPSSSFGSSDATQKPRIGARGDAGAVAPGGAKLYFMKAWNYNLSKAELDAVWSSMKARLGYATYFVSGHARVAGVGVSTLVKVLRRGTDEVLNSVMSASDGSYYMSFPYSGEVQVVASKAGDFDNDKVHRVIPGIES